MAPQIEAVGSDGTFATRAKVFSMLERGIVDASVLATIVADASKWDEPDLWDFKSELPCLSPGVKVSDGVKAEHDAKLDQIVKDAVSFHNSFGGYIVVGVQDATRSVVGFDKRFDVEALNRRIPIAATHSVECVFRTLEWETPAAGKVRLGLLFVPRRPAAMLPAQFRRDAYPTASTQTAFRAHQFYLRQRDECRPAQSAEDFAFLYSDDRRKVTCDLGEGRPLLDNNMPDRDGELGVFVGREGDMSQLWAWLSDRFDAVRLICGLGGVGKTSLAYQFSELFAYARPSQFDKLVWLGAKRRNWMPTRDVYADATRVDFFNVDDFLRKLVFELGGADETLSAAADTDDLMALAIDQLQELRFVVVIDDVDTLEDEDQQNLLRIVSTVFARTKSKVLMTARRNLGMPRGHYVELGGIDERDFADFVARKCELLKIPNPVPSGSPDLRELFAVSGGSPLFVMSILRLVSLGETMPKALKNWKGATGDRVREAAFAKEVGRLTKAEARVLLAAVHLQETSPIELTAVVSASEYEVRQAIDKLRDFSMVVIASELPGGATIVVPPSLRLMVKVISDRVADRGDLVAACREQRRLNDDPRPFVRDAIRRSFAQLKSDNPDGAVEIAAEALRRLPEHPDLLCLMARCRLAQGGQYKIEVIRLLQEAELKGCSRSEIYDVWIDALQRDRDWSGVIEVSKTGETKTASPGRYLKARTNAYLERAAELLRATRYKDAERVHLEGAQEIGELLRGHLIPLVRADARELQKMIGRKWLHSVTIQCSDSADSARLVGAVLKAAKDFSWLDIPTAEAAVVLGNRHFTALAGRSKITSTAYATVSTVVRRISEIRDYAVRLPAAANLSSAIDKLRQLGDKILDKANGQAVPTNTQ